MGGATSVEPNDPRTIDPTVRETTLEWVAGTYTWTHANHELNLRVDLLTGYQWRGSSVHEGCATSSEWQGPLVERPDGLYLDPDWMSVQPEDTLVVPFRRGDCWYIARAVDLQEATELVEKDYLAPRRRVMDHLRVYCRTWNEGQDCDHPVRLPEHYHLSLLEGIVTQEVANGLEPEERARHVRVDRGEADGMWSGLRLRSAEAPDSPWSATVIEITAHTAVLEMDYAGDPRPTRWTSKLRQDP